MEEQNSPIIIYQSEDGNTRIEVKLENETVWLTQQQLCDLYQTSRTNVVEHIQHIYEEGELDESATCRKFRQVRQEGSRMVERDVLLQSGYDNCPWLPYTITYSRAFPSEKQKGRGRQKRSMGMRAVNIIPFQRVIQSFG